MVATIVLEIRKVRQIRVNLRFQSLLFNMDISRRKCFEKQKFLYRILARQYIFRKFIIQLVREHQKIFNRDVIKVA